MNARSLLLAFAVLTLSLLATSAPTLAQQSGSPTIAVAANGDAVSASVDNQPGRSAFFLLFDRQGALVEAAKNPYKDSGNAGIPALDLLAGKGIKVLVAESFGPKIVEIMKDKGMRPREFKGSAQDAVKKAVELK